ncbi:class I SAM-dependent methyltransferase [Mucilaginibacter hurinus]|uniref:Class I SAM-dependent methyltransferase n=1 Tax=Mucilaginibacter hurinus TaxID=2201324 RepID=A0A367GKY3_9SPHI|nr:class I SAM-dependent methyltransferase [Mucilaginibacter hurinus]RCH53645.1 class I SAM-dependent methyltransferase [Mucilaginibacter hurinus]
MFHEESYDRHGDWYNQRFPTEESKLAVYRKAKIAGKQSINDWLQQIFFSCIDPLLKGSDRRWLTIGDAYGFDAQYLLSKGASAVATDLNGDFLQLAKQEGIIEEYAAENAEKLSYPENSFDYILCKESYHHFPRPYAALYEMIRVAKNGIMIIEPQDPVSKMPALLLITNLLSSSSNLLKKAWKNRFSYEPVGNFVYKVSEREFEKFAAGINLPMVAFKHINPNFYFAGVDGQPAERGNKTFDAIRKKKWLMDTLVKFRLIPGQVLATIVFKQLPDDKVLQALKADGYKLLNIPANPYLK